MPLPPRRKRCSFGGKEGVWWRRKKSSGTNATMDSGEIKKAYPPEEDEGATKKPEATMPNFSNETLVQWDEGLARPVYRRRSIGESKVESSPDEESVLDEVEDTFHVLKRAASPSDKSRHESKRAKKGVDHSHYPLSVLETMSVVTAVPSLAKSESPGSASVSSGLGSIWSTPEVDEKRTSICFLSS